MMIDKDQVLRAVEVETELPGPMPDRMWETLQALIAMGDREMLEETFRMNVKMTKESITKRIKNL